MTKPVIGVPLMGKSLFRKYMQYKYTQCLRRAGARVRILPPTEDREVQRRYLSECDGFLFPGGVDIDPALYGQAPLPGAGEPNPVRDRFELPFLKAVIAADKPLLCICRGMQLLNVAQGGTLKQDIKPIQKYQHAAVRRPGGYAHPVRLREGSLIAGIFGKNTIKVNSLHHQAAERVGKGLRVTAKSPDGFVEALEFPDRKGFCLGVQWHPEHMAARDDAQQKIFRTFLSACRKDAES